VLFHREEDNAILGLIVIGAFIVAKVFNLTDVSWWFLALVLL
jgi:hypothetical protein